jgi:hypothetical protein
LPSTHLLIRRRRQSNARPKNENPDASVIFKKSNNSDLIKTAANCSKLMSISSDLQKNILPNTHNQISSIYKRRLSKYLNLVSIHGDRNQQIVNSIFNGRKIEEEELRRLLKEVAETKMKQ